MLCFITSSLSSPSSSQNQSTAVAKSIKEKEKQKRKLKQGFKTPTWSMDCSSFSSSCSSSSSDLDQAGSSESATYVDLCPSYSNKIHSNRRGSYKAMTGSPRSRLFFCEPLSDDGPRHFLDSCFLCKKPLTGNRDIFMYRGDTPFCSEECRQEQIEMDEAKEKNRKLTLKPSTRKEEETQNQKSNATSSPKTQKIHVRTAGTVVAG